MRTLLAREWEIRKTSPDAIHYTTKGLILAEEMYLQIVKGKNEIGVDENSDTFCRFDGFKLKEFLSGGFCFLHDMRCEVIC